MFLISGLALAALVFSTFSGVSSDAADSAQNPRWEYTFSEVRAGSQALNKLGEQGWEAYAVNPDFHVAFKRAKNRHLEFPAPR